MVFSHPPPRRTVILFMSDHPYSKLTPDLILDAVESTGLWCDGRIYPLNSYENRVYQIGIEEDTPLIAKFYRPGRWSKDTLLEEHAFLQHLSQQGLSVAAAIPHEGQTLHHHQGFDFSLYARIPGRVPEADNPDHLFATGELIGQMHEASQSFEMTHRPTSMPMLHFAESCQSLLANSSFSESIKKQLRDAITPLTNAVAQQVQSIRPNQLQPIHGDCHRSNLLMVEDMIYLMDLDDCRLGLAIEDIWMHLSGTPDSYPAQLSELLEGYEQYREFDRRQIGLIPALKASRLIQYNLWLMTRWDDPAFPKAFPWFGGEEHWLSLARQLSEISSQWSDYQRLV